MTWLGCREGSNDRGPAPDQSGLPLWMDALTDSLSLLSLFCGAGVGTQGHAHAWQVFYRWASLRPSLQTILIKQGENFRHVESQR